MAKPKIPSQKGAHRDLSLRLNRYVALVGEIYDALNLEAAKIAIETGYEVSDIPFKWSDYPQTQRKLADIQAQFVGDIRSVIYRGTSEEWKNSNEAQDLIANKALKAYSANINKEKYKIYYQSNSDVLRAFQGRKDKGFNISAKLWRQSTVYTESLEASISCAIQKGTSAITLSKQISKYLLDFPSLQRDYKDKYGSAEHLLDCEYRSVRLARTEINMAYRKAEQLRWQQMDFIVGYEIKRSGRNFPCIVCETLKGKYPKNFDWLGWHPTCMCYRIPIFKSEEEFWSFDESNDDATSVNEVNSLPDNFLKWVTDNQKRLNEANKHGTLPYFIKDNSSYINKLIERTIR